MKRTVISVSVSERNPAAAIVAQALAERGIPLSRSGGQILAWAAAALARQPLQTAEDRAIADAFDMSVAEIDACLDDF